MVLSTFFLLGLRGKRIATRLWRDYINCVMSFLLIDKYVIIFKTNVFSQFTCSLTYHTSANVQFLCSLTTKMVPKMVNLGANH